MSPRRKNPLSMVLDASFVIGAVCTSIFYWIMLSPRMKGSMLSHYTTEHAVEYVVVALSFWGLVDIIRKLAGFPREFAALKQPWLPLSDGREEASHAAELLQTVRAHGGWTGKSRIARRYEEALTHVVESGSAAGFAERLQELSRQDGDRSHNDYTLIRFVIRITPVLGFLGTVVHFGTALNGISFDKMTDHLAVIVSEMGQAFNTTTSALASAMFMMFAQFVCEWLEAAVLRGIDRAVERDLLRRFEEKSADLVPFLRIVKEANEDALKLIAGNLDRQTATWSDAFAKIFDRFDDRQQREGAAWIEALDALNSRHETFDGLRELRLRQLLDAIAERQDKFLQHIHATLEKATTLREDFGDLIESLSLVAQGEGRLAEVQHTLSENLRIVRETQQLDEAVHELTAAIHLMTARQNAISRAA